MKFGCVSVLSGKVADDRDIYDQVHRRVFFSVDEIQTYFETKEREAKDWCLEEDLSPLAMGCPESVIDACFSLMKACGKQKRARYQIDLSDGAGGFPSYGLIKEKMQGYLNQHHFGSYPLPDLSPYNTHVLNDWAKKKRILPDGVSGYWHTVAGGASKACEYVLRLLGDEGYILLPTPNYWNLFPLASKYGKVLLLPSDEGSGWKLTPEKLEEALSGIPHSAPKCLVFVNPANPTGVIYSQPEVEALAKVVKKNNLLVLDDIVHIDLELDSSVQQGFFLASPLAKENTVTVISPSKAFCAAGYRVGITLTTNERLHQRIKKDCLSSEYSASPLNEVVIDSCYSASEHVERFLAVNKREYLLRHHLLQLFVYGEEHASQIPEGPRLVQYIKSAFPYLAPLLLKKSLGMALYAKPQATFFQLLGFPGWGNQNGFTIFRLLLAKGIATTPDLAMGYHNPDVPLVRISLANSFVNTFNISSCTLAEKNRLSHFFLALAFYRIKRLGEEIHS